MRPMCGFCKYCYTNESLKCLSICVNGECDHVGEFRSRIFDIACNAYDGPSPEELEEGEEAADESE